jgi:alginate O-acetyltransferase complex protein AlgI
MLFNSYEFLFLFFPLVLAGHYLLGARHALAAARFLGGASLFFYGWWSLSAVPLLLASIGFNYLAGLWVTPLTGRSERTRLWRLRGALVVNLGLLGLFKYADFFLGTVNTVAGTTWPLPHLLLPIGISFYTFTQIAFLVDAWAGKVRERSFSHYLLFVTYFPHLIAGPVLHHAQMMPQFADPASYRLDRAKLVLGLATFTAGLVKKLLLADPMGQYADVVFGAAGHGVDLTALTAWLGATAYAFQIYFDFSGYSDMAIGLSLCLGIRLPINFDSPYQATSIIAFWRRWHISLSTFLRDYLYVPLGGNRHGTTRRYLNLVLTMLLGGLWHGAAWTFVVWGALHGAFLVINHLWRRDAGSAPSGRLQQFAGAVLTFVAVTVAWVVFRAESMAVAGALYRGMAGLNGWSSHPFSGFELPYKQSEFYRTFLLCAVIAFCLPNSGKLARWLPPRIRGRGRVVASALVLGVLFGAGVSRLGSHSAFLYFQF